MPDLVPMPVRGRYAPSPSGDLHMGNLRTALLAWLFARCAGGQFVLRIEDLDLPRIRPGATQRMLDDLRWLGLTWDEGPDIGGPYGPYMQSERIELYEQHLRLLQDKGLIYPCYCSRAEIAQAASAPQQGSEDGPIYPGTCRSLTNAQQRRYAAQGRHPSLRFRVDEQSTVTFNDVLAGPYTQYVQSAVGDFIVRRTDGIFAYQFAVVVDDGLMRINQVVRGRDLLSSTARQILLFKALGFAVPTFAHVPLMHDERGQRLAKRLQSEGLAPLRAQGLPAEHILGKLAASCGLIEQDISLSPNALAQAFTGQSYAIMRAKLQKQDAS